LTLMFYHFEDSGRSKLPEINKQMRKRLATAMFYSKYI